MSVATFRLLIILSVLASNSGDLFDAVLPTAIPNDLWSRFSEVPPPSYLTDYPHIFMPLLIAIFVAHLASALGLFLLKTWARPLAIGSAVAGVLVSFTAGPVLSSAWSSALMHASLLLWGAVLALAYCPPLSTHFSPQGAKVER